MEDLDAVSVAGHIWDHWVIFNLPPSVTNLPEDVRGSTKFTDRTVQGQNSSGGTGYQGPCPPGGQSHHYIFTLYAVDSVLALKANATKADVLKALEGHILAQTKLTGVYPKP
jgi:Raf kinase inhibitor-like YbhB/YbcL family protein